MGMDDGSNWKDRHKQLMAGDTPQPGWAPRHRVAYTPQQRKRRQRWARFRVRALPIVIGGGLVLALVRFLWDR